MALLVCLFGYLVFYRWDSKVNHGRTFGYWGEFNNTSNALASIPNIKVTHSWHNLDLTLEEFGFEIETNGHRVNLGFGENDPIRTMSERDAIASLKKQIEAELKLHATNQ
jgi:hypothetical protein